MREGAAILIIEIDQGQATMPAKNQADFQIRPARADDVDAALPLIYSSGPLVWDFLFGDGSTKSAMPYLRKAWLSGKGVAGYQWHWVAESDQQVVASISVYSGLEYSKLSNQTAWQVLRYFGLGSVARIGKMLQFGKHLMPAPAKNIDYVANFGVAPVLRGQGLGLVMLEHFRARAVARGKQHYELDVATNNPRAQVLYERFGMAIHKERAYEPFTKSGLPGARRMRLALVVAGE